MACSAKQISSQKPAELETIDANIIRKVLDILTGDEDWRTILIERVELIHSNLMWEQEDD
jgi:hypothetical protein